MPDETSDALALVLDYSRRHGHGIYLGQSRGSSHKPLFAPPEHGVLALGPPRSGKTAAVVIPNVLAACGPVVAASTKPDVFQLTHGVRTRIGPVMLYDPSGTTPCPAGVQRVGWSPLRASRSWDGAVLVADAMVRAARPGTEFGEGAHWSERAGALLAAMFHGASLVGTPFKEVLLCVDRHEPAQALAALARHDAERALGLLEGIVVTDGREQSGIWSTASSVLAGYRTDAAMTSAALPALDAEAFVGGTGTLYVCTGSEQQRLAAPLIAGLLREVRSASYARSAAAAHRRGAPLLLALDELANIAPLHDLPTLVAEGGSQGVVTLACLQDLSQARARWGRDADGFLSLFGTKLVLPGIGDTRTLETVSQLAGEHEVESVSVSRSHGRRGFGRASTTRTVSKRKERALPVDSVARGKPGCLLGIEGAEPGFIAMTPWFSASPWRDVILEARERSLAVQPPTAAALSRTCSSATVAARADGAPRRSIGGR